MTIGANVEGNERLRLFYGLRLSASDADAIDIWQREAFGSAGGVRPVAPENLHVTLVFLGSRPAREISDLVTALHGAATNAVRSQLTLERYRETERVSMLVFGDRGGHAAALQAQLVDNLGRVGVPRRESRSWLAHVTVARFRERPGLRPPLPRLGTISPSEAALYHSVLRPGGAQYEIVEAVPLGG